MKHIREQLNFFMEKANCSAAQLARESGVNAVYISRVRRGVRKDIASSSADALREAMYRIDYETAKQAMA